MAKLTSEEKALIASVANWYKTESERTADFVRTSTLDLGSYVSGARWSIFKNELNAKLKKVMKVAVTVPPSKVLSVTTDSTKILNPKTSVKGKPEAVADSIIAMINADLNTGTKADRAVSAIVALDTNFNLAKPAERNKVLSLVKTHEFSVNGTKQKLANGSTLIGSNLDLKYVIPAAPEKTKGPQTPRGPQKPGAHEGGNVDQEPIYETVDSTKSMSPKEMNPYMKSIGQVFKVGIFALMATIASGPFLLAVAGVAALKYIDNMQKAQQAPV